MNGTTCVRYAEAKCISGGKVKNLHGHNLRAVRRGKDHRLDVLQVVVRHNLRAVRHES